MGAFVWELRCALRGYLRRPAFTAAAVLTLALGIGATTALFSVIRGVLLTELPYPDAHRLVWFSGSWEQGRGEGTSPPDFQDYRERSRTVELAAATPFSPLMNLTGVESPEQLAGRQASAGFFKVLGIQPFLGREFSVEEETPGGAPAVILSHAIWTRYYAGDVGVVGRTVTLNSAPHTIVGVLPAEPGLFGTTEVWTPMQLNFPTLRRVRMVQMVGRLRDGVSLTAAQSEMTEIARRLEAEHPDMNRGWTLQATPLADHIVGPYRVGLWVLFGAVVGVLLIACVNVANLVLSRALGRESEYAIRAALGASRARLGRMLLTESVLLALVGGVAGALLATAGVRLAAALAPPEIPRLAEIRMDAGVLLFAFGVSVLSGAFFGLQPALRAARTDLSASLKEGGRTATGGGRFRSALVVGQVAVTLVLLVGASLMVRSLQQLRAVDPGFRTDHLLVTRLTIPVTRFADQVGRAGFWRQIVAAVEEVPGVRSAGFVTELPMTGQDNPTAFTAVGPNGDSLVINVRSVSPGYLQTLGVPLGRGRHLSPDDRLDTPLAVVINESMARDFYPGQEAVGRDFRFDFAATPTMAQVVGVVGDIRHSSLADSPPREAYFSVEQTPLLTYNLVMHTDVEPLSVAGAVRRAIHQVDPNQPMAAFGTMESLVDGTLAQPRFRSVLLMLFAVLGLLLSMVGLYGVVSFIAAQRTREMGIRIALGAREGDILWIMLRRGVGLAAAGLVLGLLGAAAATRVVSSLVFGVGSFDPVSFGIACVVLLLVAALASYFPARRASRIDPVRALRHE